MLVGQATRQATTYMSALILTIFIILVLDGVVSASEAAIFSVPLNKAKLLAEKGRIGKVLLSLKESMERPIVTLIALSNLITIMGSVLTGIMADRTFGAKWVGVFAAVLTFLIMVFAEIIPKRLGERFAEPVALALAVPIKVVSKIFTPIIWLIEKLTSPFRAGGKSLTSEEEIAFLAQVGTREGTIEQYESEFIQKIFKLKDITAGDMMTPKPFVFFLDGNKTLGEMEGEIRKSTHTRIPIYDKTPNRILGIVYQKELMGALIDNKRGSLLREFANQPLIVPEGKLGDDLLRDFKDSKQHLAAVVDDHGNVVGVVGLEDVLEELVGEIVEEKDVSPELIKRIAKNEVLAHGETQTAFLNYFFNTTIRDRKSLNGYLLKKIGHLPKAGEIYEDKNLKFIAEEVGLSAIEKVRIIRKE
ncbi:MAG: hemolysin family protein [Candidatus Liptonbacteria bacterium]|nr:hemolysin family protein [Candidatus Liptonbacteria bacterium]